MPLFAQPKSGMPLGLKLSISQGHINDPRLQAKVYTAAGVYFLYHKADSGGGTKFLQCALELSKQCGDINQQCEVLLQISFRENQFGLQSASLNHAGVARKLAKLSGNLYREARANWTVRPNYRGLESFFASIELRDGKFNTARDKFEKCLRTNNEIELLASDGWQHKWPAIYLAFAYKSKAKLTLHKALVFLSDIFIIHHDEHTAANLYQSSTVHAMTGGFSTQAWMYLGGNHLLEGCSTAICAIIAG
ncbi:hypothetical protein B0H14DRAFT_2610963 [Mycena olivaceomarginata]|nr:hypothetical protein B0H14DRAFT_2610963 [Mycena olivaceomarginata]